MRTIGLIGGMSWESSAEYYRLLNQGVRDRLGPTASARCLLWSFDFAEVEALQHQGDWDGLAAMMVDAAQRLEGAGAELLLICTNTMHRVAPAVEANVDIPLLHIADPVAARIGTAGLNKVALLGTRFTMEQDFYRGRLSERYGLTVFVPDEPDRATLHRVIFQELVAGKVLPASRQVCREIIARLVARGAEGVILGCTEIMLLIGQADSPVPVFDTTALHAAAAVETSIGG